MPNETRRRALGREPRAQRLPCGDSRRRVDTRYQTGHQLVFVVVSLGIGRGESLIGRRFCRAMPNGTRTWYAMGLRTRAHASPIGVLDSSGHRRADRVVALGIVPLGIELVSKAFA